MQDEDSLRRDDRRPARESTAARPRGPVFRLLTAALLLWGGLVLVIYGARFHTRPVLVPQEAPPAPQQLFPLPGPPLPPQLLEPQLIAESEPRLIRDVTVGGVVRLQTGEIQRTYAGEAPTACPT